MDASNEVDNSIYILAIVNYILWERSQVVGDWRLVSWRNIAVALIDPDDRGFDMARFRKL